MAAPAGRLDRPRALIDALAMEQRVKRYDLHASPGYHATLAARAYERRLEDGLRRCGLSRIGWCILLAVVEEGLRHPSDIAGFIGIGRSVASRTLGQMERDGLVIRRAGIRDRRKTEIDVTPEGRRRLDAAIPLGIENSAHFAAKLSADEKRRLIALLTRLRAGEDAALPRF